VAEEPILSIRDLSVSLPAGDGFCTPVKNVTLDIPRGGWVCLVGESGSGKTLAALSIGRLLSSARYSGSMLWRGEEKALDLVTASEREIHAVRGAGISYVFQDPHTSLNPVLRVGEQMTETYLSHFKKSSAAEAEKASLASLAEARLPEVRRVFASFPHELSGGMKQRAMIALALLTGPKLLIADEPTTALDVTIEHGILDLLKGIRHEWEVSCLFITHNIAVASEVADRIYVMKDGLITEMMEKESGVFNPKTPYATALFRAGLRGVFPKTEILL
jgi:ABC-type dipeptide/oligopeptide/nickel transport system ATPase component